MIEIQAANADMLLVVVGYELLAYCELVSPVYCSCFFFNDTATPEIYTLSLHDALPIYKRGHTANQCRLTFLTAKCTTHAPADDDNEIGRAHV